MSESISALNDIVTTLKSLGAESLTVLFVVAFGYIVRQMPWIDNRFIPGMCPFLGAVFYALIASPGEVDPAIRNPEVKLVGFGFILGVLAWALHFLVIARVERKVAEWRDSKHQTP